MKMIFLSYSAKDIDFARKLYHKLMTKDLNVWFGEKELIWGSNIIDETQKALYNSSTVITVVSSDSISSQWMAFEIGAAKAMGKKIIPILLSRNSTIIPFHIKDIQVIEAQNKSIDEIILTILNTLNIEENFNILTKLEMDVLQLIGKGYISSEIAEQLKISKRSVDTVRKEIMKKLNVTTLKELIKKAIDFSE